MKLKEQESSGIVQSAGELAGVGDPGSAELSAVDEYFAESNGMCVVKAIMYEEKL